MAKKTIKKIIFITIFLMLIIVFIKGLITNYKIEKMRSEETRIEFFETNRDIFEKIKSFMVKKENIISIEKKCTGSKKDKIKGIEICYNEDYKEDDNSLVELEEIIDLYNKLDIIKIEKKENIIIFLMLKIEPKSITYQTCVNPIECSLEEFEYEYKGKIYILNKINNEWFTSFRDVPSI